MLTLDIGHGARADVRFRKGVFAQFPTRAISFGRPARTWRVEKEKRSLVKESRRDSQPVPLPLGRFTLEIFHKGKRVASHLRSRGSGQTVTNTEHRPRSHREHLEWTPSRMVAWARTIGPNTARLFERIMGDKPHPETGYRGCLGIIRLAQKYSAERTEAAAERALLTGACRYKSIESILKNSLDVTRP